MLTVAKMRELSKIKKIFHEAVELYEEAEIESLRDYHNILTAPKTEFDYIISSIMLEGDKDSERLKEYELRCLRVRFRFDIGFCDGDRRIERELYDVVYLMESEKFVVRYISEVWVESGGSEPTVKEKEIPIESLREKLGVE